MTDTPAPGTAMHCAVIADPTTEHERCIVIANVDNLAVDLGRLNAILDDFFNTTPVGVDNIEQRLAQHLFGLGYTIIAVGATLVLP